MRKRANLVDLGQLQVSKVMGWLASSLEGETVAPLISCAFALHFPYSFNQRNQAVD